MQNYHQDTSHISKSGLDLIRKSPAKYHYKYLSGLYKEKKTDALIFGSAFHTIVLEPELFQSQFVIMPDFYGTGSVKAKQEFINTHVGKEFISMDTYVKITGMRDSILAHEIAGPLICANGLIEKTFTWVDHDTNVNCKCKPDKFTYEKKIILDLKSTESADETDFMFSAKKYRYYVQASFYFDGLEANGLKPELFVFIAVEKEPPFLVNCFFYGENSMDYGRETYKEDLYVYKRCLEENKFIGYPNKITKIEIPGITL